MAAHSARPCAAAPTAGRRGGKVSDLVRRKSGFFFMSPRDIGLFLRSAKTDAAITRNRGTLGDAAAFDAAYESGDPWASADARYLYQRRKYDVLASLLPQRRFAHALDLGCGLGLMSRRLAAVADQVTGIDISARGVAHAAAASAHLPHVTYRQGDALNLDPALEGQFDLLVIADTLYYLPPPVTDATLKQVALSAARLLQSGGVCLLANHYFAGFDADSRISRRIHDAFAWSPAWRVTATHRRPFYLASLLTPA